MISQMCLRTFRFLSSGLLWMSMSFQFVLLFAISRQFIHTYHHGVQASSGGQLSGE
jgi:hypothetical protein